MMVEMELKHEIGYTYCDQCEFKTRQKGRLKRHMELQQHNGIKLENTIVINLVKLFDISMCLIMN